MTAVASSTHVRRFVLVALIAPAVLTISSLAVQLFALPHVPATIAIHWGPTGAADGFGPAWTQPFLSVVVGFGIPLLIALLCLPALRRGDSGPTYRLLATIAASMSALAAVLFAWTLVVQRGLENAADAPSALPGVAWAFVAALIVAVGAWCVQPRQPAHNVSSVPASGLALTPGERAAWFATAALGRAAVIAVGSTIVLLAGAAITVWFAGAPVGVAVLLGALTLVLFAMMLATSAFHVRVDREGLTVVSLLGFPRFHVPLSDVRGVAVGEVSPMGEFGGYGIRSTVGASGVVLRRGPAITITRTSGRRFVVTVDDAARGGALLDALVRRETSARA